MTKRDFNRRRFGVVAAAGKDAGLYEEDGDISDALYGVKSVPFSMLLLPLLEELSRLELSQDHRHDDDDQM